VLPDPADRRFRRSLRRGHAAERQDRLSHVELFGYLERSFGGAYLAGPEDARDQILSAASCPGPDGITLFTYHYNVHEMGKTVAAVKETAPAVASGLRAFSLIAGGIADEPSRLAVYIPYNDWWVDRWTECFVPALDAFRRLGVPAGIAPFLPPKGEEILPYYPYHANIEQLEYLLDNKIVLVLPDIAGMQDTDSLMLKAFVERGGTALLFGPRIPFGDGFARDALVGERRGRPPSREDRSPGAVVFPVAAKRPLQPGRFGLSLLGSDDLPERGRVRGRLGGDPRE